MYEATVKSPPVQNVFHLFRCRYNDQGSFRTHAAGNPPVDIDIVAWRGTAEFVEKYFGKGRMIVVGGRLQIRNWEDRDGNKRRSAEVVADSVYFGDSKRDGDGGKPKGEPTYDPTGGFSQIEGEEELPF